MVRLYFGSTDSYYVHGGGTCVDFCVGVIEGYPKLAISWCWKINQAARIQAKGCKIYSC